MLHCPKCNQSYEEGVQRFCTNDGVRLTASPGAGGQKRNVFTSVLNRIPANGERSKMFTEVPVLAESEPELPKAPAFLPIIANELPEKKSIPADTKQISKPEISLASPAKPAARLIKLSEIPVSQAALGDRAANPSGREALTWNNPEVLIGQTVKGRYTITSQLGEDETGIVYLAEDKMSNGKKVVVRVLMEEDADDLSSRILAEERVSLSHVNHPNVAHLFDSGELLEGFPFIVTEYVAGASLKEKLVSDKQFDFTRTARIIRQSANAISEAHRNGVLHRNLKPKNIILGAAETGTEQVKITDFGVFDGFEEQSGENLAYLSPEQLQESYPTYASDIYSLAVITFQLLTGRLPFEFSTAKELLKSQKEGLSLQPTDLRSGISPLIDEIFEKALAYSPNKRYPKARDFGDAFANALTTQAPSAWKEKDGKYEIEETSLTGLKPISIPKPVSNLTENKDQSLAEDLPVEEDSTALPVEKPEAEIILPEQKLETVKATNDLAWEKRSPEQIKPINAWRIGSIVLGILILSAAVWGIWNYFLNRPEQPIAVPAKVAANNQKTNGQLPEDNKTENTLPASGVDAPPLSRTISQPPDTIYFENSKNNLKGDLAKNFRGFSLYYPKDWVKNSASTNFVDIARVGATGTPIEQMTVTYYSSRGTMAADMEIFPRLTQEANKKLSALIADYHQVSQGETTINGGWKAYELKFQGNGKTTNGDTITLWGRCLWIPSARLDVKSGFLITMLATSNSPEVKSADDVGVKGELAGVLETFEPAPLDTGY